MKIYLVNIRKQKNLSQKELSKKSGISESYISQLESGSHDNPGRKVICSLAKALECTLNDLFGCDGNCLKCKENDC